MDELSRVIAELMKGAGASGPAPDPAPGAPSAPAPSMPSPPSLPDPGPLAGLTGGGPAIGFPGSGLPIGLSGDRRLQLLQALRPFLREERRSRVDRLCRLMRAAYGVRGTLQSLGGMLHV